jgi:hypothetical protein
VHAVVDVTDELALAVVVFEIHVHRGGVRGGVDA